MNTAIQEKNASVSEMNSGSQSVMDVFGGVKQIRILLYRAYSSSPQTSSHRFVAHDLNFNQLASADTPAQALSRLINQIAHYLIACRECGIQDASRENEVADYIVEGFEQGTEYDHICDIVPLEIRDLDKIILVHQVYEAQDESAQSLEELVSAA